ncbi:MULTISPECIES: site-specific DNA-methyltransferase [Legionella]|uniref:site-specific DNA-methyltransferase n=1 Tax=Legionella TaxID=445 RepID=UPI0010411676|nr:MULTISPECIES: site-specific DNA-methyltransferase [Legionella]
MIKTSDDELFRPQLIWPGKKQPERISMPFQIIETINEERNSLKDHWKNRLIWGENLLVTNSLLEEFAGKIDLIYIDPPFATGQDFSQVINIGDQDEVTKMPSAIEIKVYRDTWGNGIQSYFQMMHDRLYLMKELLSNNGSIYIHLDYRVVHYIKIIADDIFGKDNFRNEIVWAYRRWTAGSKQFQKMHDTILFYSKSHEYYFNIPYEPYGDWIKKDYKYIDENTGKRWRWHTVKGKRYKVYLEDENKGVKINDVWQIPYIVSTAKERVGYATQKPESLLSRIIEASSKKDDLIADFFCGSGTTGVVAEKLGRRWIMADIGRYAIHTTRKRLLDINTSPFTVQNLGKYERQHWVKLNGKYTGYLKFILELYKAESNPPEFKYLQGRKSHTYIHIGNVDAPITFSEVMEALQECKENNITALDVLGWEWELGLNELIHEEAQQFGISLNLLQIPQEVMELSAKDTIKYDIQFFELAFLEVDTLVQNSTLTVTLTDFIIPNPKLLPVDLKGKIKNWSDFIDYWAVDWLFNREKQRKKDTFHNMSQRYRTRKNPKLDLSLSYDYPTPGNYEILVKVIDIFGNDTTKHLEIRIK